MECPYCLKSRPVTAKSETQSLVPKKCYIKLGHYFRDFDRRLIQRYKCLACKKSYSSETTHVCRYQKKRHLNIDVFKLLVSGISQRRCAPLLQVNQKTVIRKFMFLGELALIQLEYNRLHKKEKISAVVFDDMETFEHSKCKPLSITLAVEDQSRYILGFKVSSMPAKGLLSAIAKKKYGFRADDRPKAMIRANVNRLFRRTWNTTKKIERLNLHIAMYALYHNEVLI